MSLEATVRQVRSVTVIDLAGRLTFSEKGELHELLRGLLDRGDRSFLLNLHDLKYLDSSGIGELVRNYCTIKKQGGELKMMYLTPKVEEVLRITKSCFLLDDFTDEEAAVRSFA